MVFLRFCIAGSFFWCSDQCCRPSGCFIGELVLLVDWSCRSHSSLSIYYHKLVQNGSWECWYCVFFFHELLIFSFTIWSYLFIWLSADLLCQCPSLERVHPPRWFKNWHTWPFAIVLKLNVLILFVPIPLEHDTLLRFVPIIV